MNVNDRSFLRAFAEAARDVALTVRHRGQAMARADWERYLGDVSRVTGPLYRTLPHARIAGGPGLLSLSGDAYVSGIAAAFGR